jgi:hypothetical protein
MRINWRFTILAFQSVLIYIILMSCSSDSDITVSDENSNVLPIIFETTISAVTQVTAEINVEIIQGDPGVVPSKGIVWSTNSNPTQNDNIVEIGNGSGSFSASLDYLEANTPYFVRPYLQHDNEIVYGEERTFTTLEHREYQGSAYLYSQNDVDAFGAECYTQVTGSLVIEGMNINDLSGLSCLQHVAGGNGYQGFIIRNTSVTSLNGLNNLREVFGLMVIDNNEGLTTLEGLNKLRHARSGLHIQYNHINSLEPLNNLESIGEGGDFDKFTGLQVVEDYITSLSGLENLTIVKGFLIIVGCELLENLNGLENISNIIKLNIANNSSLTDFCGIRNALPVQTYYNVNGNAYNPSQQDIIDGNCRL